MCSEACDRSYQDKLQIFYFTFQSEEDRLSIVALGNNPKAFASSFFITLSRLGVCSLVGVGSLNVLLLPGDSIGRFSALLFGGVFVWNVNSVVVFCLGVGRFCTGGSYTVSLITGIESVGFRALLSFSR